MQESSGLRHLGSALVDSRFACSCCTRSMMLRAVRPLPKCSSRLDQSLSPRGDKNSRVLHHPQRHIPHRRSCGPPMDRPQWLEAPFRGLKRPVKASGHGHRGPSVLADRGNRRRSGGLRHQPDLICLWHTSGQTRMQLDRFQVPPMPHSPQLGRAIGGRFEVLSGLAAGETVVLRNANPSARGENAL